MADAPKPEAGNPTRDFETDAITVPQSAQPTATTGGIPTGGPTIASVRVEGIAELVSDVRHELHLIGRASKFEWVNRRLILLRNAIIAASVVIGAIVVLVMCYREAYRETLSITSFDCVEFKNGREKEGFAELDDANRAEPRCDQPYLAYAKALIERKRVPEAKQKLETLLRVSPESDGAVEAKDMLAKLANAG